MGVQMEFEGAYKLLHDLFAWQQLMHHGGASANGWPADDEPDTLVVWLVADEGLELHRDLVTTSTGLMHDTLV